MKRAFLAAISLMCITSFTECSKDSTTEKKANLVFDKFYGESGTGLNEFNLQDGNMWHCSFANDTKYIYIKDVHNHRIQRLDTALNAKDWFGYYNNSWGWHTEAVAGVDSMSPQNIYYIKDYLYATQFFFGKKIIKISTQTGAIVARYSFKYDASSFVVDNNFDLYVYTSGNNKNIIIKYNSAGDSLFSFGGFGSDNGEFNTPDAQMLVDANNNVYVYDSRNGRVQKFDDKGTFILSWKVDNDDWNSFDLYNNKLYLFEKGNLNEYDLTGNLLRTWDGNNEYYHDNFKLINGKIIFEDSYSDKFELYGFSKY